MKVSEQSSSESQARTAKRAKSPRRKRLTRFSMQGLISGAEREALAPDSPRKKPSLSTLKFMKGGEE